MNKPLKDYFQIDIFIAYFSNPKYLFQLLIIISYLPIASHIS